MSTKDDAKAKNKDQAKDTSKDAPQSGAAERVIAGKPPSDLTEDMKKYLQMREITGTAPDINGEAGMADFIAAYNQWVSAGRPLPKMDAPKVKRIVPRKLYRTRYLGKQKLYFHDTDGKKHGKRIEDIPVYKEVDNGKGGKTQMLVRTDHKTHFEVDYAKEAGEKLVAQALNECVDPTFYFIESGSHGKGGAKYSIRAEDFNGDFDAIIQRHKERKYIL